MTEHATLSSGTAFMMIAVAFFVDGLQALLTFILIGILVNPFINVVVAMVYGIWFSHHGMSMMSTKTALPFFGTIIGEFVPILNALPLWTAFIIFAVTTRKVRDAL